VAFGGSLGRRGEWRGKRGEARRGKARAALELGATRGGERQQEVARGGRKWRAAALQQRSRAGAPEEEERGGVPRGSFAKIEKFRDLTVN
jgi:hypothetical protein